MAATVPFVELWRGDLLESLHSGHAVICDETGAIEEAWGDAAALIYPRSSCKMIQALPLVESGAADAFGLKSEHLALACASHNAAPIHTDRVAAWLEHLGLTDDDFRCGPQLPGDEDARKLLMCSDEAPCRRHNNCSGKHSGFLTLSSHLKAGPDYHMIDHPVQRAVKATFEDITQETSPTFGIDGCSAPNHACTVAGLARAAATFATADGKAGARATAMSRLTTAMMTHPELVAGEGRACTKLMRACEGRAAIKTGAEGVFLAILPSLKKGVALKITDGATRASECAMASILIRLGVLSADHPVAKSLAHPEIKNWDGLVTGRMQPASALQ